METIHLWIHQLSQYPDVFSACWKVFLILSVLIVAVVVILHARPKALSHPYLISGSRYLLGVGVGLILLTYLILATVYLYSPYFWDHVEPAIAAISWIFYEGQPLYHAVDAANRYSLLYGPMLYIMTAGFYMVLGPSIFSAKMGGVIAAFFGLFLSFTIFRGISSYKKAFAYTGLLAGIMLLFLNMSFWNRADPFIFFFTTVGLVTSVTSKRRLAAIAIGIAMGINVDLKIHSFVYFLPVMALLFQRFGFQELVLAVIVAALAFIAPFVHAGVSFSEMLTWLHMAARHGLSLVKLKGNLLVISFLGIPGILLGMYYWFTDRRGLRSSIGNNLIFILSMGLSVLTLLIFASKPGNGPHHFIPLVPIILYAYARMTEHLPNRLINGSKSAGYILSSLGAAWALTLFVACTAISRSITSTIVRGSSWANEVVADIQNILNYAHTASIVMGVGSDSGYESTFYRPLLVFKGNPYLIDVPAMMDMELAGVTMPKGTKDVLTTGSIDVWLIPSGTKPFSIQNWFNGRPLFDEAFKSAFFQSYRPIVSSRFFDMWVHKSIKDPDQLSMRGRE